MRDHDEEDVCLVVALVPSEVTWDILACCGAVRKDRALTLRSMRRALERGKSPRQFTGDSDFDDWLDDPEFQKAILRTVE